MKAIQHGKISPKNTRGGKAGANKPVTRYGIQTPSSDFDRRPVIGTATYAFKVDRKAGKPGGYATQVKKHKSAGKGQK